MPTITCRRKPVWSWWFGVNHKNNTYITNRAKIITGTLSQTRTLNKFHLRTNTSGQNTLECHSAECVGTPGPHSATFSKIITETPFKKNACKQPECKPGLLLECVPLKSWWYGVHHKSMVNQPCNVHRPDLLTKSPSNLNKRAAMKWILGKYSTRVPSVLRQLCPKFSVVMNLWTNPTAVPKQYLMLGSDSPFQDITQNPKIHKPLHARDWWLLHHWPEMTVFMENFPSWFETLQKSHDIWRAAMISITIRSWEPLTDPRGTLNITRPHNANTLRMNLLQIKVLQMTAISVYKYNKQRKKKEWLCLGPCQKQENFHNYAEQTTLNNEGGKVFVTGPSNAKKALMITGAFFRREGNCGTTFMWFQASWRGRLSHGGVMVSTRPHIADTRRTAAELHNQDRCNKAIMSTKISEQTSCKCPGDRCVPQGHTVQISQWSSLGPLRKQENFMSTKLVCKRSSPYPGGMTFITEPDSAIETMIITGTSLQTENLTMSTKTLGRAHASKIRMVWCSSHEHTQQRDLFSTQRRWWAPSLKRHFDGYHHANYHWSTDSSQILLEWKQESLKCHSAMCLSRNHTMKHMQWNIDGFPSRKKRRIKSAIYNHHGGFFIKTPHRTIVAMPVKNTWEKSNKSNKVSEATSLKDHGGVGFITRPYRAHTTIFITGTCSQRRSKITIKWRTLTCTVKEKTPGEIPPFQPPSVFENLSQVQVEIQPSRDHAEHISRILDGGLLSCTKNTTQRPSWQPRLRGSTSTKCHGCGYVSRDHTTQLQQYSWQATCWASASLRDHGGTVFITWRDRTNIAMSSTGTCSATKRRWLATLQTRHADGSHHVDHHWYGVRLLTKKTSRYQPSSPSNLQLEKIMVAWWSSPDETVHVW